MELVALITARGGSKSIPEKNIKLLAGKPLIAWTIQAALESSVFNRVIVSTNDDKITQSSLEYGAEVPFVRPGELALDNSPHIDVVSHAIEWLNNNRNYYPEWIMLLQPTSPLRTTEDITNAIDLSIKYNADSIISVSIPPVHPYLIKQIKQDGKLSDFIEKPKGYLPRQLHPEVHFVNGAIYLTKSEIIMNEKTFYPEKTFPYRMPVDRSLDIDTPWDFYLANLIMHDKCCKETSN